MTLAHDLGATFLFESLAPAQLAELASLGDEVQFASGDTVFEEGRPAEFLWVLLDGEMALERNVGGQRISLTTATRPGTYGGGIEAFSGSGVANGYRATARTVRPSRLFKLSSKELARLIGGWSPVAKHFLDGYVQRLESIEATVRQREHLISLGRLAAGLAHEVNNPAAAALRAAGQLRQAVHQLRGAPSRLATAELSSAQLRRLVELSEEATASAGAGAAAAPPRSGLALADAEEELGAWLEARGVDQPWDLASTFAAAGVGEPWLARVADGLSEQQLADSLHWIAASLLAAELLGTIDESVGRISQLVSVVKEYSYMDRAPVQDVDVHDGIEKTLLVLGTKLRSGVTVVRDYDAELHMLQAHGAGLNQVWTNLIDNAIDAMDGQGQLTIRTRRAGDWVVVEICDHGTGIPPDVQARMFDPFFTTKEPGKGTGLGLDIVRRIVVDGHHGEISVDSQPGDTRFTVRLPLV